MKVTLILGHIVQISAAMSSNFGMLQKSFFLVLISGGLMSDDAEQTFSKIMAADFASFFVKIFQGENASTFFSNS